MIEQAKRAPPFAHSERVTLRRRIASSGWLLARFLICPIR